MPSSQAPEVLTVSDYWKLVTARLNDMISTKVRLRGVIRNFKVNGGNAYFDIVEDSTSASLASARSSNARISGVIWRSVLPRLEQFLASQDFEPLGNDLEMVFVGSLNIYPPSGRMSFDVSDIDIDEMRRSQQIDIERVRAQLRVEGIFEHNRQLVLPEVPLRVALVTAETGTVQHDFQRPLNASGIAFDVTLMHTRVGSLEAAGEIARTLKVAGDSETDLVVLLRGGGSATDLAVFNTLEVCRAVATCSKPVWCAIGHAQDQVLANEVAHRSFDVPQSTGVALVEWVNGFLEHMEGTVQAINAQAYQLIQSFKQTLFNLSSLLSSASTSWATSYLADLSLLANRLAHSQESAVDRISRELNDLTAEIHRAHLEGVRRHANDISQQGWSFSAAVDHRLHQLRAQLPREEDITMHAASRVSMARTQVALLQEKLNTRDPDAVLRLGYVVVIAPSGIKVKSLKDALPLSQVDIHFVDGKAAFRPVPERTTDD